MWQLKKEPWQKKNILKKSALGLKFVVDEETREQLEKKILVILGRTLTELIQYALVSLYVVNWNWEL